MEGLLSRLLLKSWEAIWQSNTSRKTVDAAADVNLNGTTALESNEDSRTASRTGLRER